MAEKLVIISDMWGSKQGLWITSYLGYLQQYYDIEYYDSQQLANIDLLVNTKENIHKAFVDGGIEVAAEHLLKRSKEASHYLAFSVGGSIVWKAALKGLPVKSMYLVSSTRLRFEEKKPDAPVTVLCGGRDPYAPGNDWTKKMNLEMQVAKKFGHSLYSDEMMIQKICLDLLRNVTQVDVPKRKVV
ncbi:MAG: hypothetical protein AB3N16_09825 [Flavobacteriaceae bacterium]